MRFWTFWIALTLLLAACTPVAPVTPPAESNDTIPPAEATAADEPSSEAANQYVDPDGLFSVPIPTNWAVTQAQSHATFTSPDDGIRLHMLTIDAASIEAESANAEPVQAAEAAVAAGWQRVDPAFDQPVEQTLEPPSESGIEQTAVINYEFDAENEQIYQAVVRLHEGRYYLILVDAGLSAAQQRQAQLNIISTGFTIEALAETDLTDTQPLPASDVLGELESFIVAELQTFGIPGAAVAIVQDGEVVYSEGFGVTEQGGDTPITPQTHMMIGSTGKSLTTLLMATLVDDGQMDWDTPVVDVLPGFAVADPELTESLTLRNLVCACTGVPRRDMELLFNAHQLSAEDVVDSLATFEFFTDFGEAFQYSNQMVATAGYAAAAADGAEYGTLFDGYVESLERRVLDPIGMEQTTVSFEEVRKRARYATPHALGFDATYEPLPLDVEAVLVPIAPAGSHWSTLEDMTRYLLTELATGVAPGGERVVSSENLRETWQPQVPVSAEADYGLGWLVSDYHGLQMISHNGNTLGFTSEFTFLPDVGVGVVVLTNGQSTNSFNEGVRQKLLELLFQQEPETDAAMRFAYEQLQTMTERPPELQEAVDAATVEPYLGTYSNDALGQLVVRWEGDALVADVGEFVTPLLPLGEEGTPEELVGYMATEPPLFGALFEFVEDDAGEPLITFGQGVVAYTFQQLN